MSTQSQLSEISRLLRNLIRTGVVSEVDTDGALCRVQTGELQTGWINWLARRAGRSRDWWAPSVGEQVLLLAVGGELAVKVENAAGTKCPRCWKHSLTPNAEGLCPRCAEVVRHLPDLL